MEKQKRLGAFLHNHYYSDGKKSFSYYPADIFLTGLKKYGYTLTSVCATVNYVSELPTPHTMILEENGISLFALPYWEDIQALLSTLPKKWSVIRRTLRSFVSSCDVVWIRTPTPLLGLILSEAKNQRKPVVIHAAGNIRDIWKGNKHRGLKKIPAMLTAKLLHHYSRYLVRNQIVLASGSNVVKLFSGQNRRVVFFVDNLSESRNKNPQKLRSPSKLLYVGSLIHRKGIPTVFSSIRRLKEENVDVSFTIVGNGPLVDELKRIAHDLRIYDRTFWRGYIPSGGRLDAEYLKSGILVMLSELSEGFPRAILEAWSHGLAVVASNVSGLDKMIRHGENGMQIPVGNDEELAKAIKRLIGDPRLYERIVRCGFNYAEPFSRSKQTAIAAKAFLEASGSNRVHTPLS
jgi:glycosyltransferase involved in cell wall biosynthesis